MEENNNLHRQIHPSFVVNDHISNQAFLEKSTIVSSSAFAPTQKDKDKLSVYNGSKFTPKESYAHFIKDYISCGVLTVTVKEVIEIDSLSCEEDNDPFDGHSYIDFTEVTSKNQKTKKAGKLRDAAVKRGWTFKP